MTKKEFERWKRFSYDKSEEILNGYVYLHNDCPQLLESEKDLKYKKSYWFKCKGEELILGEHFQLTDKLVHYKWIQSTKCSQMFRWGDLGGKRDSKLNWVLKNIQNVQSETNK